MGTCPSRPVCPTHNQCTFTVNTRTFAFACGLSYSGGQLGDALPMSSISNCITACSQNPSCITVTHENGLCSLRNEKSVATLNPNATSLYSFPSNPSPNPALSPSLHCSTTKTNILTNPGFEDARDMRGWIQSFSSSSRPGLPTTSSPHTGAWAYAATGSSPTEPWSVSLRQSVSVLPRRSYTVTLWVKQEDAANCKGKVKWEDKQMMAFTPGLEYEMESVMFGVGKTGEGEVVIEFECEGGGEGKGVFVDDVGMKVGWAPWGE